MRTMFLIGHRITHSLSPAMWNHFFESTGRDITYGVRDVDEDGLEAVHVELRSGSVLAANVTMPHKAWAAKVADQRTFAVATIGVANLLLPQDDGIHAFNTDEIGARATLATRAPYDRVVVLGAGGTALAILEALIGLTTTVAVVNRTYSHASEVAARYSERFESITAHHWADRDDLTPDADLVVSAVPAVDESPLDVRRLNPGVLVYDAVYRREPTAFQRELTDRGMFVADGLTHLGSQAVAMLEPLGFDPSQGSILIDGLEAETGRTVSAWGARLA
ncbi:MAG: hypothetical protein WEA76_10680 [Acidimicrobiia bacterium]